MNQQFPGSLQFPPSTSSVQGSQYPGLGSNQGNQYPGVPANQGNQYQGVPTGSVANQGNQYQGVPANQGNQYQGVQGNQYQANPYLGTTSTPAPLMLQIYDSKPNNDYKSMDYKPEMKYNVQPPTQLTQIQVKFTHLKFSYEFLSLLKFVNCY